MEKIIKKLSKQAEKDEAKIEQMQSYCVKCGVGLRGYEGASLCGNCAGENYEKL